MFAPVKKGKGRVGTGVFNGCNELSHHLVGPALMDLKDLPRFLSLKAEMAGLGKGLEIEREGAKELNEPGRIQEKRRLL